jgi:hypothetical protein
MTLDRDSEFDVSGKPVTVRLTWWDLARVNLGFMPRLWAIWAVGVALALGAWLVRVSMSDLAESSRGALVVVSAVATVATLASMAGFLCAVAIALTSPASSSELLGDHTYTFQPEGLRDQTSVKDTLIEWGRVREVRRTRSFILINVAPGLCHALPRRSFGSNGEFQAFWQAAERLSRQALAAVR